MRMNSNDWTSRPAAAGAPPTYVFSARTALPRPVRNERGEGRGEGHLTADAPPHLQARRPSSPQPSPPSAGGEGEETGALNTYPHTAALLSGTGCALTLTRGAFSTVSFRAALALALGLFAESCLGQGFPPVFIKQPLSQTALAGSTVTFSVEMAQSATALTYQWRWSGGAIRSSASSNWSIGMLSRAGFRRLLRKPSCARWSKTFPPAKSA